VSLDRVQRVADRHSTSRSTGAVNPARSASHRARRVTLHPILFVAMSPAAATVKNDRAGPGHAITAAG
jgi:hypothetical protein